MRDSMENQPLHPVDGHIDALKLSDHDLYALMDQTVDMAKSYWGTLEERSAYPEVSGRLTSALFSRPWTEDGLGRGVFNDFSLIADSSRPSGARFFGYIFGSGEPIGALADWMAAVLNQNVTAWRSAPAAVSIERAVVGWLAEAIGCPDFTGSLCGGGSAANLMGLAMAREAKLAANQTGARAGIVYASDQVHMSISKAVALLGIGRDNLRLIPVDDHFRMRTDLLRIAIAEDRAAGRFPIAIVATAGTTTSGAVDPLSQIADIARREKLWMHVDGSYGGLAALATSALFEGMSQADSLSLDAHKWLYQTMDCGCLLFRDAAMARTAFSYSGDYARSLNQDPDESFAFFDESIELSRRFRALKLWMSLQYHGRRAFRDAIRRDIGHAELLSELVTIDPDLELLAPTSLSVVCFRHRGGNNEEILRRVISRGRVYLSNDTIRGEFALRACFVNHRTSADDVRLIIAEIKAAAEDLDLA